MLRIDWNRLGRRIEYAIDVRRTSVEEVARELDMRRDVLVSAIRGGTLGAGHFLTLCDWLKKTPMDFAEQLRKKPR